MLTLPCESALTVINSLLFADDAVVFGPKSDVQSILNLTAKHSPSLGYRRKPFKCAVLGAAAALLDNPLTLYDEALPVVYGFTYLGTPFKYKGLHAPISMSLRSSGAVKTLTLLNSVGVNHTGFSLLLSTYPYKTSIRPKIEYVLAISHLSSHDLAYLDTLQNRLVGMFVGSTSVNVAKYITCIPSTKHRSIFWLFVMPYELILCLLVVPWSFCAPLWYTLS